MTTDLQALIQHLRGGDWNLRAPQEMADMIADKLEAALAAAPSTSPAAAALAAAVDDSLGLVTLPPIRVDRATHASLMEAAKSRGVILQALVRERLAPYATPPAAAAVAGEPVACHPLQGYADSYRQMATMGDGRVHASAVALDIEQNMIPATAPHPSPSAAEQAGRWVPLVPTEDMLFAAEQSKPRGYRDLYTAMVAAAPSAPPAEAPAGYVVRPQDLVTPDWCAGYDACRAAMTNPSAAEQAGRWMPVARVADVHMSRYTIEWLDKPMPEGTVLFADVIEWAANAPRRRREAAGFESGLVQLLNEARCLSKETVGNRELASRIIRYMRMHAPQPVAPAGQAAARVQGDVPDGYMLVMVPKLQPHDEPDWEECIRQAEVATGLKVERNTLSIVIREVRRWLAGRSAGVQGEVAFWVLREQLEARETTCNGRMWFSDPVNSAWVPVFLHPAPAVERGVTIERSVAQEIRETLSTYVTTYNDCWERGMDILEPMGDKALALLDAALSTAGKEQA